MAKICIDAGHYGTYNKSPGNSKYSEAKVMWKLHLLEKEYLEKLGHTVILTRSNQEKDMALGDRGRKSAGCDLFMSDHSNAVGSNMNESVDYVVIYHLTDDKGTKVDDIAKEIAVGMSKVIANVMETKQSPQTKARLSDNDKNGDGTLNDNYYGVLHGARMVGVPAILPEHSFHTNTRTVNWLMNDDNVKKLAKAKAEYLHKYFTGQTVNIDTSSSSSSSNTTTTTTNLYRVRKSWDDAKSQIGAYSSLENAKKACTSGYYVFDWNGKIVYPESAVIPEVTVEQLYRIRKTWDDVKSQIGAYKSLDSAKKNCPSGYSVYDWNGKSVYTNTPHVTVEENTEMYRVRKSWDDAKSQLGAYKSLDNAKNSCPTGYNVYDSKGNVVFDNTPVVDNTPEDQRLYRVRKSWDDAKSQLGAYKSLDNAKNACTAGYTVYDWNGKVVYTISVDIPATEVESVEPTPTPDPEVKEELKVEEPVDNTPEDQRLYRVRKSWDDDKSQLGAYKSLDNAIQSCKCGYSVFDWNGKVVYTNNTPEATDISPLKGISHNAFIEYVGQLAREDMEKTGILASVTIAQACLESGYGQTELSLKANNLFGMKASLSGNTWKSDWDGKIYAKRTEEEYETGVITYILADFRSYDHPSKSIKDHSDYLCGAMEGSKLRYEGLIEETNYKKAIQIIKDGGYATDSKYVDKIINLIEKYNLDRFDTPEIKDEFEVAFPNPELDDKLEDPKIEEVEKYPTESEVKPEEPKAEEIPEKNYEVDEPEKLDDIKNIGNILNKFVQLFIKFAELILSIFKK